MFFTLDLVAAPGVEGLEGLTQRFDPGLVVLGAADCLVHMDLTVWQDVGERWAGFRFDSFVQV